MNSLTNLSEIIAHQVVHFIELVKFFTINSLTTLLQLFISLSPPFIYAYHGYLNNIGLLRRDLLSYLLIAEIFVYET